LGPLAAQMRATQCHPQAHAGRAVNAPTNAKKLKHTATVPARMHSTLWGPAKQVHPVAAHVPRQLNTSTTVVIRGMYKMVVDSLAVARRTCRHTHGHCC
jgi:hypothetical protein